MSAMLTPSEVADRWHCSARHVRRLAERGDLSGLRVGDLWRFSLGAVEAFEATHANATVATTAPAPDALEVSTSTSVDGFTLPVDYEPVFKDLWPGHEATTKKTAPVRG